MSHILINQGICWILDTQPVAQSRSMEDILDYPFIAQIVQQGFSRFPVVDPTTRQVPCCDTYLLGLWGIYTKRVLLWE